MNISKLAGAVKVGAVLSLIETVTVAESQFVVFNTSHIWYVKVYSPQLPILVNEIFPLGSMFMFGYEPLKIVRLISFIETLTLLSKSFEMMFPIKPIVAQLTL